MTMMLVAVAVAVVDFGHRSWCDPVEQLVPKVRVWVCRFRCSRTRAILRHLELLDHIRDLRGSFGLTTVRVRLWMPRAVVAMMVSGNMVWLVMVVLPMRRVLNELFVPTVFLFVCTVTFPPAVVLMG